MDQTVDGAVGGCLQRVVGTVQPVLQRLRRESDRFDCTHESTFNNYTRLQIVITRTPMSYLKRGLKITSKLV